jgi:hypothetical protein
MDAARMQGIGINSADKSILERVLKTHRNPVVEDAHLKISGGKEHVGETMEREFHRLKDEFIMAHKATNAIGELKMPVDINVEGGTVTGVGKAIHLDDDPSTEDEITIHAETVTPYGNGGKDFNFYNITFLEQGDKLTKKIHSAGHTEDAMGDIGMGGGGEVVYTFDRASKTVEYNTLFGKEVIPQKFTEAPAGAALEADNGSSRILEEDSRVFIGDISLPKNQEQFRFLLAPVNRPQAGGK